MKDKTLPYFLTISPTYANLHPPYIFSYFKKFHPSPLLNK